MSMPPSINDPDAGEYDRPYDADDFDPGPEPDWFHCEFQFDTSCLIQVDDANVSDIHRIVKACPSCLEPATERLVLAVQYLMKLQKHFVDANRTVGLESALNASLILTTLKNLPTEIRNLSLTYSHTHLK